jgi:NAD(P)-dependent dehydrogenase (short-subunit alcohol dehydrogenase family)
VAVHFNSDREAAEGVAAIYTATEMAADVPSVEAQRVVSGYRPGRMVRPEEVANVTSYLLGPEASAVTGEVVTIGA